MNSLGGYLVVVVLVLHVDGPQNEQQMHALNWYLEVRPYWMVPFLVQYVFHLSLLIHREMTAHCSLKRLHKRYLRPNGRSFHLVMFSGFRVSQMVLICKATSGFSHSAVLRLPAVKTIFWFITPNL